MKFVIAGLVALSIGIAVYVTRPEQADSSAATSAEADKAKGWAEQAAARTKGLFAGVLEEEETPEDIVKCRLPGNVLYMLENDCSTQGGQILAGSRMKQSVPGESGDSGESAKADAEQKQASAKPQG
jgi:hypothetical protein